MQAYDLIIKHKGQLTPWITDLVLSRENDGLTEIANLLREQNKILKEKQFVQATEVKDSNKPVTEEKNKNGSDALLAGLKAFG